MPLLLSILAACGPTVAISAQTAGSDEFGDSNQEPSTDTAGDGTPDTGSDDATQTTGFVPGEGMSCDDEEPDYIGQPLPAALDEICGASAARIEAWETVAALTDCAGGQWLLCPDFPGFAFGEAGPSNAGFSFDPDGTLTRLVIDGDGLLQLGQGLDHEGTWEPGDADGDATTGSDEPTLIFTWGDGSGGWNILRPEFTSEPEQMRNEGGRLARP